ncbi:ABC-type transporter, permease subunit [Criblamydia sequanensis CRIB-18]|uniref:ABC-type transporter, permease subunit n=1 Tax=Candidatus Criblamydia sequanensis CRIB-18 TaxID=1437425 RepID=A0A090D2Z6_9BACT|nr:ABC transporter permease [Criblamydia sequanensis]CDR35090.1 ABC-type transporter, permease subunit [Criblamydia sequanensis CRIB-18]
MINTRISALVVKELWSLLRDKKSRTVLILPPLVQLLVFAFAATLDVKNVSIGFLNRDSGSLSFDLLQRFRGSPTFQHIYYFSSDEELKEAIDTQKVIAALYLDEEFTKNILAERGASLQSILDGRKSNSSQIVQGYIGRIVDEFANDVRKKLNLSKPVSKIIGINWFNPNLIYSWYTVPSLCAILTMVVSVLVTALSIARERELGTFDQLLVSPLTTYEILLGKTIPAVILAFLEGNLILAAAFFVFDIPFNGHLLLLYPSMLIFILAVVGVGLFISSLSKTQQQAILGSFVFISPSTILSGFATPIENMPLFLQKLTLLNPLRYFLVIVKGVFLKDMGIPVIIENTWPLMLIALVTLTASSLLFKSKLE